MAKLTLLVPILSLAVFIKEGESVRCFTCSSDLNPQCNDPFEVLSGISRLYVDCDSTGATNPFISSKTSCKKQKTNINGQVVISRGCTWTKQDDYSNLCPTSPSGHSVFVSFCETCDYDGCNGASAIGTTLALILAPLGLLLFK